MFDVSKITTTRDLEPLVGWGILKHSGKGKSMVYSIEHQNHSTTRKLKKGEGRSELKSTFLPSVKTLTKNCTWENLYWEQPPLFLRSKKLPFLAQVLSLERKCEIECMSLWVLWVREIRLLRSIELCAWENLYWEQQPLFLRSKKLPFLAQVLSFKL